MGSCITMKEPEVTIQLNTHISTDLSRVLQFNTPVVRFKSSFKQDELMSYTLLDDDEYEILASEDSSEFVVEKRSAGILKSNSGRSINDSSRFGDSSRGSQKKVSFQLDKNFKSNRSARMSPPKKGETVFMFS